LIGLAVLLLSIGAMEPLTRQSAGTSPAASTQVADDSVTLPTGSPIADGGIDVPTLADVQSEAVMTMSGPSRRSVEPGGVCASAIGTPSCQTIAAADTA
jgi:hypothetical protein